MNQDDIEPTISISDQITEYKITYKGCEHFVRVDKESAEWYEANQDKWELGYESPGQPKKVRISIHCAAYNQTFVSHSSCECEPLGARPIFVAFENSPRVILKN